MFFFPSTIGILGPIYVDLPEVKFKEFLEKLRKTPEEYNFFLDEIYSSLNSSLHSLNTDGYIKL